MPNIIGPIAGNECKLYYQTTLATTFTVAGAVHVREAQDVNLSAVTGSTDVASRVSIYKSKLPTLTELELTFSYLYPGDVSDTIFNALRAAFIARTPWHWAVMDNEIATAAGPPATPGPRGAQGFAFPGIIYDLTMDQPLEGTVKVDLKVSPVRARISGTLVNPDWFTVNAN